MNPEPVLEVDAVSLYSFDDDTRVVIVASGTASSTGWSRPALTPMVYVQPPPDGIWGFTFVATPPAGPAADVLSPVSAVAIWDRPKDAKGVRIHAKFNSHERRIKMAKLDRERPRRLMGKDGPFPAGLGGENPLPWLIMGSLGGDKPHPWSAALLGGEHPLPWLMGGEKPLPWHAQPAPAPFTLDGTLQHSAGVGGETTGTTLTGVAMDIDVRAIVNGASLEGKRARYTGHFTRRHYVERGWVTTFVATDVLLLK